jgi:hypothetical protein
LSTTIVFQQLDLGNAMENKWIFFQFAIIFSLLNKGKPMTNYEDLLPLFKPWNFDLSPKKFGVGWEMIKHIDHEVRKTI